MSSGKQTALKPAPRTARSMGWVLETRVWLSSTPSKGHTSLWRGISVTGTGVYSEEPLVLALRHAGCLDTCGRSPVTGICNRESMSYTLDN